MSIKSKKNQQGFTLLELMVVASIISLLVTIALASFQSVKMRSRDSKRIFDVKQIQNAMEFYYDEFGYYPCEDLQYQAHEGLSLDNYYICYGVLHGLWSNFFQIPGHCFDSFAPEPPDYDYSICDCLHEDQDTHPPNCYKILRLDVLDAFWRYFMVMPENPSGENYLLLGPCNTTTSVCKQYIDVGDDVTDPQCLRDSLSGSYIIHLKTESDTIYGRAGEKLISRDGCLEAQCDGIEITCK